MARPPQDSDAFIREVEENLRRDQTEEYLKKNGPWIIGAALIFLAAIAGWIYWQNQQAENAAKGSEELVAAIEEVQSGSDESIAELDRLAEESNEGIATQAKLTKAAALIVKNDRTGAIAIYKDIAGDSGLDQPYRDLALLRQTALEFDALKPEEVISRLESLAKPESAWFGSAGEMTAMAMLKLERNEDAGRMFAAIAADKNVPGSIRSRAVQIAGTLGIDATSAIADITGGPPAQ